jgi:hypothetical protein
MNIYSYIHEVIPDETIAKEFLGLIHCFLSHPAINLLSAFALRLVFEIGV